MPPSVTVWNRLEPRPRAPSLSLAARIRDPLWMLARQAQFEEFRGADSGSPAFAQLRGTLSGFVGWRVRGETDVRSLPQTAPLEALVAAEPFTPDLATRVELGQVYDALLRDALNRVPGITPARAAELHGAIRKAYALPPSRAELLTLPSTAAEPLNSAQVAPIVVAAFAAAGIPLSGGTTVSVLAAGSRWSLTDPDRDRRYLVVSLVPGQDLLAVYVEPPSSRTVPLTLPSTAAEPLNNAQVAPVVAAFASAGIPLSGGTTVSVLATGSRWSLADPDRDRRYLVVSLVPGQDLLAVYVEPPIEIAGDVEAVRLLEVCAGRSTDGAAIYQAARHLPILPPGTAGSESGVIDGAAASLTQWVEEQYGGLGRSDPPGWDPARLGYAIEAVSGAPDGKRIVLAADPGGDVDFDWDAFDRRGETTGTAQTETIGLSVIPGHVRFSGMPNARFWDFESGTTPFGEMQPDRRDLAKLILMDFMLVHGNDWFLIPLEQKVGTLCQTATLIVRDVFGVDTLIERADARPTALLTLPPTAADPLNSAQVAPSVVEAFAAAGIPLSGGTTVSVLATGSRWSLTDPDRNRRYLVVSLMPWQDVLAVYAEGTVVGEFWTMFSTAVEGEPEEVGAFFLLPPSAGALSQIGPVLEDVRFLRDEMANMVWGVEHATENAVGDAWLGHERDLARTRDATTATPASPVGGPPLRYLLQTAVPEHWVPFLPVAVRPEVGDIQLERSFMTRDTAGAPQPVRPAGRILLPTSVASGVYRICEEEVPREGARVSRVVVRSRWVDGSTHLWIMRRKAVGRGEGSSGLRFDLAIPRDLPPGTPPP